MSRSRSPNSVSTYFIRTNVDTALYVLDSSNIICRVEGDEAAQGLWTAPVFVVTVE